MRLAKVGLHSYRLLSGFAAALCTLEDWYCCAAGQSVCVRVNSNCAFVRCVCVRVKVNYYREGIFCPAKPVWTYSMLYVHDMTSLDEGGGLAINGRC